LVISQLSLVIGGEDHFSWPLVIDVIAQMTNDQ